MCICYIWNLSSHLYTCTFKHRHVYFFLLGTILLVNHSISINNYLLCLHNTMILLLSLTIILSPFMHYSSLTPCTPVPYPIRCYHSLALTNKLYHHYYHSYYPTVLLHSLLELPTFSNLCITGYSPLFKSTLQPYPIFALFPTSIPPSLAHPFTLVNPNHTLTSFVPAHCLSSCTLRHHLHFQLLMIILTLSPKCE